MEWDVVDVKPIAPLALRVQFADRTVAKVQFEQIHLTGVFPQAHISDGAVAWLGDLDLALDAMYMAIKAQGEWVLR